ncbi:MAG TPA: sortase [Anaerolineae bacterium]|nr:sortase [Anaerolineae bacterium]
MMTAVTSRRIKFTLLFAGLTVATILILWVTVRFALALWPGTEESTVLAAQPVVTAVPTMLPTLPPPVVAASSPAAQASHPTPTSPVQSFALVEDSPTDKTVESVPTAAPTPIPQPPIQSQYPQLIIPSLGINRVIRTVPVVEGQWDISQVESDIGWLQTTGEYPGDEQGMTFVGHVTRPWPEIAGPLAELAFMKPGDEIIYRKDGTDYVYALEKFLKVDPESVESLYVPDGDVLSLATCSTWNYVNFDYDERLIARARLIRTEPSPDIAELSQ